MGSILPCCLPFGKAGGLQILCCQGIKVTDYNFTLDALALKPSGFCNVRDYSDIRTKQQGLLFFFSQPGGTHYPFIHIHPHDFHSLSVSADNRNALKGHPDNFAVVCHQHQIVIFFNE